MRQARSEERQGTILGAALECFSSLGYDDTTIEDIRIKAEASTGSIYHHFGSKDRIAAALYLKGVRESQEAVLGAMLRARTARTGIAAQVEAYIDWVVDNPAFARFLFATRHAAFLHEVDSTIDDLNIAVHERAAGWITERVNAGELPDLEPAMRWAIVLGPCRHWAGAWLRGATSTTPSAAKRQIATASFAALTALR